MKYFLTVIASSLIFLVISQEISGSWYGSLTIQGTQLRITFNITKSGDGYKATMDSPDQGAKGIPLSKISYQKPELIIELAAAKINYRGIVSDSLIVGVFKQNGLELPLDFSRQIIEKKVVSRPQTPSLPYPYKSIDVKFKNKQAGIELTGTLTLPKNRETKTAVILISGSGPQNRDEEILGHKPFLVLADYLTKNGIAVLRFDDRGVGKSGGKFDDATSADFATDVSAAIDFLKSNKKTKNLQIGLIGHSEGGIIAPMVATSRPEDVDFMVLLAGPGIKGDSLLLMQLQLIAEKSGESSSAIQKAMIFNKICYQAINENKDVSKLKTLLTQTITNAIEKDSTLVPQGMNQADITTNMFKELTSPWFIYFIQYDPASALEKVKCPVLAINGSEDIQVPSKINLNSIEKLLHKSGNDQITCIEITGLNHLFQECVKCSIEEYGELEQTISPKALQIIDNWIKRTVNEY